MSSQAHDITALLAAAHDGEAGAADALLERVYGELHQVAARLVANESPGATIQATVLVHEAWMRVSPEGSHQSWERRAHFFGAAAESMRRVLVDEARKRRAHKRGGDYMRVTFVDFAEDPDERDEQVLVLHDALEQFEAVSPELARLVKLRYFVGMTIAQVAETLGSSVTTVKRDWIYARAWLREKMDAARE